MAKNFASKKWDSPRSPNKGGGGSFRTETPKKKFENFAPTLQKYVQDSLGSKLKGSGGEATRRTK